jgi:aminopeptidase N
VRFFNQAGVFYSAYKASTQSDMRTEEPRPVRLKDYHPPDWRIETAELDISLHPTATAVRAKLKLMPNTAGAPAPLVLDGDELHLRFVQLDGKPLPEDSFVACRSVPLSWRSKRSSIRQTTPN